ncbi:hypothetical protein PVK06_024967 [Gossypium arboreum]|uniref:Uncharacterized protein n=1 Tax=Gossypium arboreum TaxID=29729 RepID=A0ABR0PFE1_GOSAR|nr:hypothetical protein PVK06_024967 [Gossypium arboreum]
MRAPFVNPNQERNMRRNGVEIFKTKITANEDKEESQTNSRDESGQSAQKGNEKGVKKARYRLHLWKKEVISLYVIAWDGLSIRGSA